MGYHMPQDSMSQAPAYGMICILVGIVRQLRHRKRKRRCDRKICNDFLFRRVVQVLDRRHCTEQHSSFSKAEPLPLVVAQVFLNMYQSGPTPSCWLHCVRIQLSEAFCSRQPRSWGRRYEVLVSYCDRFCSMWRPLAPCETAGCSSNNQNLCTCVVAVRSSANATFINWRLLGLDPDHIGFNVDRSTNNGNTTRLNSDIMTTGTSFVDATTNLAQSSR